MSEELPGRDDVREVWDALAPYWDERMDAGETWQRHLIQPSVERLLELRPGERVLEIASGNGEFARRMGVDPERGTPGSPGYVYTEVPGVLVARMRLPG